LDVASVDLLGEIRVFVQTQPGTFAAIPSRSLGAFPEDMQVADPRKTGDFNRDLIPDLAFIGRSNSGNGELRVFLGRRDGGTVSFDARSAIAGGTDPSALALGDLNGDGRLDAVVTDAATSEVRFYLGDGNGGLSLNGTPRPTGAAPRGVMLADVDDDNRPDVITTNGDGTITVFLSSNPPPTPTATPTPVDTATLTPSPTPDDTATLTPSLTSTPSATHTHSRTPTRSRTPENTRTVTQTPITPGIFAVEGEGCAHVAGSGASASDAMPFVVLAALALLRRRR
jgi:MYXO-CTERM domain-containing protein